MTVTALDPVTALLVIDLQKGVVAIPTAHPMDAIVANAAALVLAFRAAGQPVVLINVDGRAPGRTEEGSQISDRPADWAELIPELQASPNDHRVTKRTWGGFTGTDLEHHLREKNVTQVVIVGVATTAGVESTARFAHELGFNVTLAVDAMTDRSAEAHHNSVTCIFPRMGETGTTREIIALLQSRTASH